jgi:hypothetical protein
MKLILIHFLLLLSLHDLFRLLAQRAVNLNNFVLFDIIFKCFYWYRIKITSVSSCTNYNYSHFLKNFFFLILKKIKYLYNKYVKTIDKDIFKIFFKNNNLFKINFKYAHIYIKLIFNL